MQESLNTNFSFKENINIQKSESFTLIQGHFFKELIYNEEDNLKEYLSKEICRIKRCDSAKTIIPKRNQNNQNNSNNSNNQTTNSKSSKSLDYSTQTPKTMKHLCKKASYTDLAGLSKTYFDSYIKKKDKKKVNNVFRTQQKLRNSCKQFYSYRKKKENENKKEKVPIFKIVVDLRQFMLD